jgi:hypothetical protein
LAALHNFICIHEPNEKKLTGNSNGSIHNPFNKNPPPASLTTHEEEEVDKQCDQVVQTMWDDYWQVCAERGIDIDEPIASNNDEELYFNNDDV